jgi:hypothetical protein
MTGLQSLEAIIRSDIPEVPYLFLEQAEGYVKAQGKSTCPFSTMKEVFEHGGGRLDRQKEAKGCLNVLPL